MDDKKFNPVGLDPNKIPKGNEKFSFLKGFRQVPVGVVAEVRDKIVTALDLKSRTSFYNRLYGVSEPKITEYQAIEKVFAEYGITDCWGAGSSEKGDGRRRIHRLGRREEGSRRPVVDLYKDRRKPCADDLRKVADPEGDRIVGMVVLHPFSHSFHRITFEETNHRRVPFRSGHFDLLHRRSAGPGLPHKDKNGSACRTPFQTGRRRHVRTLIQ